MLGSLALPAFADRDGRVYFAALEEAIVDALAEGVPSTSLAPPERERGLLRRAAEVAPEAQLALQARFQAHVEGGISKTIDLASDVPVERIMELILRARELGCKGVALWCSAGPGPARCIRCAP